MTSRECVRRAIAFEGPGWLPHDFPGAWGTDFAFTAMTPSPDARRATGRDEWGALWDNLGPNNPGEVKEHPLRSWDDFERLPIPDIRDPARGYTDPAGAGHTQAALDAMCEEFLKISRERPARTPA